MEQFINFQKINIILNKKTIISNIDFNIKKGEFVFLTGKIGAGKTSLLRAVYADISIKGNKAEVLGFNLNKIKKSKIPLLRRNIGFIFQDFKFLNDRDIKNNLRFVLEATGWKDDTKIKERVKEVLTEVEMLSAIDSMPFELSGGEQQRISVARALLNSPKIILADEPTGNLDEETALYITQKIYEQTQKGTAVVFVTHDKKLIDLYKNVNVFNIP